MKKRAPLVIGIILCFLVIGTAYIWATSMMDSVYMYRSPLHSTPPKPGDPIGDPMTRSVVIVLIDGLRYDTSLNLEVMPYLNELRAEGASTIMHSRPPSYSQPSYGTLLTGAWPDLNDAPAINLDYAEIPTFTQDDIFSAAYRKELNTAISGFNWFEKLVPQVAVTASYYTAGEDQVADRDVTDAALPWIKGGNYSLVLIHLDQVDFAGHHEGGAMDPRWNAAATRTDELLREIVGSMDLNQDTLLVVSDHGHLARGGHGGQDADILIEPFVLVGKGVVPGNYADIQMVDVAPTVATLLGVNIPATNQGQPRIEMLELSKTHLDNIKNALSIQQGLLASTYSAALKEQVSIQNTGDPLTDTQNGMEKAKESKLSSQQILRGILGIFLIILFVNLAAWNIKPYALWIVIATMVYLILFNLKYVYLDHKTYSLSSVISSTDLIISTALTSGLALLVSWLIFFLGAKIYRQKSLQAAEASIKYLLFTLAILAIPVIIHFIVDGAVVTWALPNFLVSFLGLLFLIQMLIVAAVGLLLIAISSIIGIFNRNKYQSQVV